MKRLALVLVLLSTTAALAGDLEVPLGGRAKIPAKKAVEEVVVRDPAMLNVITTNGEVSLEGKESGVTGVTVTYAGGEQETLLVEVGTGTNSKGPRMQQSQKVDLKQMKEATAQVKAAEPTAADKAKATKAKEDKTTVHEASDVVRAAVEQL
jgi:hypothetical protein